MNPKLAQLHTAISSAIDGMTLDDLSRHPEGKWNSAEILEHLNLTYTGTVKSLERCLASGETNASVDRKRKRLQRLVVIGLGYLPHGRISPARACPRGAAADQIAAEILQSILRMDALIEDCETRFGKAVAISDHPVLGPLKAEEWRKFHLVHGKHHVKQIIRLKQSR
jgi:Protein of unknown function (DUF1569).